MATTTFDKKFTLNIEASKIIRKELEKPLDYEKLDKEYLSNEERIVLLKNFKFINKEVTK
jgi:hypothetical protein